MLDRNNQLVLKRSFLLHVALFRLLKLYQRFQINCIFNPQKLPLPFPEILGQELETHDSSHPQIEPAEGKPKEKSISHNFSKVRVFNTPEGF